MNLTILICVHSNNDTNDCYLKEAIDSLCEQTCKNFKVVVVLDECWYKTKFIVEQSLATFENVILEKNKKNGLANAKNYGLSKVDTEYVGFLDSDDLYVADKIEKQLNFLKNKEVDFLGTHTYAIYNRKKILYPSCFDNNMYNTHDDIVNILPYENVLTHGSMIIKMSALKQLNFYNNVKGAEDWDLWKRAANSGYKFYQLPERLYIYSLGTSVER
jgi:teichuronic acid biosynthesis glycosyltransferase TuaG